MSWRIIHWDEGKVWESLKQGRYDDVSLTGWGRLDDLVASNYELGVVEEMEKLGGSGDEERYIPEWFVHTALGFRSYVGGESVVGMQQGLLKDRGILRMLGVTGMRRGLIRIGTGGRIHHVTWIVCGIEFRGSMLCRIMDVLGGYGSGSWMREGWVEYCGTSVL